MYNLCNVIKIWHGPTHIRIHQTCIHKHWWVGVSSAIRYYNIVWKKITIPNNNNNITYLSKRLARGSGLVAGQKTRTAIHIYWVYRNCIYIYIVIHNTFTSKPGKLLYLPRNLYHMNTQCGGGLLFMLPSTRYDTKTSAYRNVCTVQAFPILYTQII